MYSNMAILWIIGLKWYIILDTMEQALINNYQFGINCFMLALDMY